jgi:hypothetical protein
MHAPIHCSPHQTCALKYSYMFGDRGKRHLEGRGELGNHRRTLGQPSQQSAPGAIAERVKHGI